MDDDSAAAEDDEELEGLDLGAGGAETTVTGGGKPQDGEKKNVRMAANVDGDNEGGSLGCKRLA